MDKYEYHVRLEQIHQHIAEKNYKSAAEIADTIDWRKVRSVRTLCTISDVYKMARRYEDSSALLELAYDKRPGSKPIVYALCEISLKNNDLLRAMKYFNIFSQIAPDDYRRLILQYLIYRAQDGTKEGQIQILEELKERELIERWCYELAELYHEVGFNTKCVEECDEIAAWFAGGKYCRKALELKRLIEPLTPKQQALYDGDVRNDEEFGETKVIKDLGSSMTRENEGAVAGPEPTQEFSSREMDQIQVQTLDVNSGFNTMDIQRELAESLSEILEPTEANPAVDNPLAAADRREAFDLSKWQQEPAETQLYPEEAEEVVEPLPGYAPEYEDEIPAGQEEVEIAAAEETAEESVEPEYPDEYADEAEFTADEMYGEPETEELEAAAETSEETIPVAEVPVTVGDMTELSSSKVLEDLGATQGLPSIPDAEDVYFDDPNTQDLSAAIHEIGKTIPETKLADHRNDAMEQMRRAAAQDREEAQAVELSDNVQNGIRRVVLPENPEGGFVRAGVAAAQFAGQKTGYDDMLTIEAGGQLGLIVPEKQAIEKQITGQMSIEDILNEWEQVKKEQEKSLEEKVKNRVKKHTGELFEEYDEAAKEDLLEKLSTAAVAAEEKEARRAMEEEGFTEETETEEAYEEESTFTEENEASTEESEIMETSEAETAKEVETAEVQKAEKKPVRKKAPAKRSAKPEKQPSAPLPDRTLTAEEKELFDSYIQSRRTRGQLIHTLEKMSMAAYTGNVIVTGERDAGTVDFAQNLIKMMRIQDGNFSGKAGKIDGAAMNKKDPEALFDKLKNGALIIDNAGALNCETAEKINRALQNEERGILLLLVDGRKSMDALLQINDFLTEAFDTRVDIEALNDKKLVEYGRRYAYEKEYAIDELGALALHTRIENLQTMDHAVTVGEVRDIVRGAIQHANRKNLAHFCDVLFGRRYDEEDMVVLRENDFLVDL